MANLNNTLVQGDLRVTGSIFNKLSDFDTEMTGASGRIPLYIDGHNKLVSSMDTNVNLWLSYDYISGDTTLINSGRMILALDTASPSDGDLLVYKSGVDTGYGYMEAKSLVSAGGEPLLTTARGVEKKDGVANGKILGFYSTIDTGSAGVYGIALGNSDGCLRYNTSYIVVHDINVPSYIAAHTDPQNPSITIPEYGGHRFAGTAEWAYNASSATNAGYAASAGSASTADAVKCVSDTSSNKWLSITFLPNDSPTTGSAYTLDYTSWLKYNPNTDKLNIGSSTTSGTRTEIGAGSITLYKTVSGSTTSFTIDPGTIAPTNHASAATTYGIGSTSNHGHVKLTANLPQSGDDSSGATAVAWKSWDFSSSSTSAVKNWNSLTQTSMVQITGSPSTSADTTSPESGRVNAIAMSSDGQYAQLSMGWELNYRYKKANQTSWEAWEHVVTSGNISKLVVSNSVGTENDVIYFT